jgi:ATP-binding cassette, subfamily B, multidrug efflux pump
VALVVAVLRFVWRYLIIGFSRILEKKLRDRLFDHVLRMDQPFFERWTIGDLMAHASNDLATIQMACGMGLVAAVDALVMSSAALGFMLAINVKLTLIALLPMPLLIICTRILSGRLHHRFNLVQEQFSLLTEFARATLVSIRLIKAYTLERFQEERFRTLGEAYVRSNLKVAAIQGLLFPIATLVGNVGMLLLLYYGGSPGHRRPDHHRLVCRLCQLPVHAHLADDGRRLGGQSCPAGPHQPAPDSSSADQQPVVSTGPTLALPQTATSYACHRLALPMDRLSVRRS